VPPIRRSLKADRSVERRRRFHDASNLRGDITKIVARSERISSDNAISVPEF
jgi:hypothetical protein